MQLVWLTGLALLWLWLWLWLWLCVAVQLGKKAMGKQATRVIVDLMYQAKASERASTAPPYSTQLPAVFCLSVCLSD